MQDHTTQLHNRKPPSIIVHDLIGRQALPCYVINGVRLNESYTDEGFHSGEDMKRTDLFKRGSGQISHL